MGPRDKKNEYEDLERLDRSELDERDDEGEDEWNQESTVIKRDGARPVVEKRTASR